MKKVSVLILVALLHVVMVSPKTAQQIISNPAAGAPLLNSSELDQLLGPIALYPDPLIAELLPAAIQPYEIVDADHYLQAGGDPNQVAAKPWSSSVQAMAHYPDVVKWMDENLAWTAQVGQAFLNQSEDVMNSIQRLRAQAQALGNLQNTPQQTVVADNGAIEIVPANPDVIYVPVYQPDIVYARRPVFGAGPFISFGIGFSIGSWLNRDWDWHQRRAIVWDRGHERPHDWWYRPGSERFRSGANDFHVWTPRIPVRRGNPEDRGWDVQRQPARVVERPQPRQPERRAEPVRTEVRREPARVEHIQTRAPEPQRRAPEPARPAPNIGRQPPNGALVGVHSAPETRAYSNRGQQSRQIQSAPGRSSGDSRRGRH